MFLAEKPGVTAQGVERHVGRMASGPLCRLKPAFQAVLAVGMGGVTTCAARSAARAGLETGVPGRRVTLPGQRDPDLPDSDGFSSASVAAGAQGSSTPAPGQKSPVSRKCVWRHSSVEPRLCSSSTVSG